MKSRRPKIQGDSLHEISPSAPSDFCQQARAGVYIFKGYNETEYGSGIFEFQINNPDTKTGKRTMRLKVGESFNNLKVVDFKPQSPSVISPKTSIDETANKSELSLVDQVTKKNYVLVFNVAQTIEESSPPPPLSTNPIPETRLKIEEALHRQYREKIKDALEKYRSSQPDSTTALPSDLDALFLKPLDGFRISVATGKDVISYFSGNSAGVLRYGSITALDEDSNYYRLSPAIGTFPLILVHPDSFEVICVYDDAGK